ncbi:MAG: hypothetical protein KAT17_04235 [Candidatus Aminicenantes bacterium]|nr:hypothetical protein [Candidatus Aminicenantes bacterium]
MYKILFIALIGILVYSCDSDEGVRSYVEEISSADQKVPAPEKEMSSEASVLEWVAPEEWVEKKGSGIRLTTFIIEPGENKGICTVVGLNGDGGGIQANIQRWMGQLNLLSSSIDDIIGFISKQKKFKTSGGFPARFIDFTSLSDFPDEMSMLVSIITLPKETIFIKVMEKKVFLLQNRKDFFSFSKSFKFGSQQDFNRK